MTDGLITLALNAARQAAAAILPFYGQTNIVEHKGDGSPLTLADLAAHNAITAVLAQSSIDIVSEEGGDLLLESQRYWLVDPLDGTKDFLAKNDEFTVNIALVEGDAVLFGVVVAPALDELYAGGASFGSWFETGGVRQACRPQPRAERCCMAASRFHDHPDMLVFAANNGIDRQVQLGSALKYGRLAKGEADVFPRLVGSSEWDTAAGQAVVEGAGGQVLHWGTGMPLRYGKPRRRNPRLLTLRAPYSYSDFVLQTYDQDIA